jgi:hypothetical protein
MRLRHLPRFRSSVDKWYGRRSSYERSRRFQRIRPTEDCKPISTYGRDFTWGGTQNAPEPYGLCSLTGLQEMYNRTSGLVEYNRRQTSKAERLRSHASNRTLTAEFPNFAPYPRSVHGAIQDGVRVTYDRGRWLSNGTVQRHC